MSEAKNDWRIGLTCKPKYRNHDFYYERGTIRAVHPNGTGGIVDKDRVLRIEMFSGLVFLAPADDWITA